METAFIILLLFLLLGLTKEASLLGIWISYNFLSKKKKKKKKIVRVVRKAPYRPYTGNLLRLTWVNELSVRTQSSLSQLYAQ
jgi:hypothetical protein